MAIKQENRAWIVSQVLDLQHTELEVLRMLAATPGADKTTLSEIERVVYEAKKASNPFDAGAYAMAHPGVYETAIASDPVNTELRAAQMPHRVSNLVDGIADTARVEGGVKP